VAVVDDRLPTRVRVGYALGSLATGAFGTVPGLLLLPYLTDTLGVAAGLGGILVLLPKAWDIVANPLAGRLSDRTVTRLGARRPYLLGGGLAVAVLFAALFAGPARGAAGAGYVTVIFLLTATAYAAYQVPYVAMPAELTESATERTRLAGARIVVLALAILVSGALAPAVVDAVGGPAGYRAMGVGVGALIAVGVLAAFALTAGAPTGRIATAAGTLRAQLRVAAAHPPFVRLLACFVIQAVAIGTMLAGVRYFADHVLERPGANSILFACFVGPALVVMPLWTRLGRHLGKRAGYLTASVLFAAGGLLLGAAGALGAGWPTAAPRWSASATPGSRRSRCRCCPTPSPPPPPVPAGARPACSPACGPPARRSAWRWAPACSACCCRPPGTCRPPAAACRNRRAPVPGSWSASPCCPPW
jgi:Na+/melibiose symporter-like transporter